MCFLPSNSRRSNAETSVIAKAARPGLVTAGCLIPLLFAGVATASQHDTADLVMLNAAVYTGSGEPGRQQAIVVSEERITFVGSTGQARRLIGPNTRVIDLRGHMVLPGLHDLHIHPLRSGVMHRLECRLPFRASLAQSAAAVADCAALVPAGGWIRGGQWAGRLLVADRKPERSLLDDVAPDHPVFLWDEGLHNAWLNTAALDSVGITRDTTDPPGGEIVRDAATGDATGLLLEDAANHYSQRLPRWSDAQSATALQWSVDTLNRLGITTIRDAATDEASLLAYRTLDERDGLSLHVIGALVWKSTWSDPVPRQLELLADRNNYQTRHFHPTSVKIFLDGVPETRTSVFLRPYADPGSGRNQNYRGSFTIDPQTLTRDVVQLDRMGLGVVMHTGGDGSVRAALDAVGAARAANGDSGPWHEVAHAVWIDQKDLQRFHQLRVSANASPFLWYPGPHIDGIETVLGRSRAACFHPFASLSAKGALVVAGSDWPAGVPSPNPWPLIEAMVTRNDPTGANTGTHCAGERVSLDAAIEIYTVNGARAIGRSHLTGSIAIGKSADMIVIDRHLFDIDPTDISETRVLLTIFEGKLVHRDADFLEPVSRNGCDPGVVTRAC